MIYCLSVLLLLITANTQALPSKNSVKKIQLDIFNDELNDDEVGEFQQIIDYQNPDKKFSQRFFINSQFADSSYAPVFYLICGEDECRGFKKKRSYIVQLAKMFNAHLVALEHRYYGKSIPNGNLRKENLKFLNMQYALNDLARFQEYLIDTRKMIGPWIVVGGSYPGTLAAHYRLRFPHLTVGAISSSAPIIFKQNFYEYDRHVAQELKGPCLNKINEMTKDVEKKLDDEEELKFYREKLHLSDNHNKRDILYIFADITSAVIQYGYKESFCASFIKSNNLIDDYLKLGNEVLGRLGLDFQDLSLKNSANDMGGTSGMRQWFWQSCREFGWFQVSNPDLTARSNLIDLNYHQSLCVEVFDKEASVLDKSDWIIPLFSADFSRIIFTNGTMDPWSTLSMSDFDQSMNDIYSFTFLDGSHCEDLSINTQNSDILLYRLEIERIISSWINGSII